MTGNFAHRSEILCVLAVAVIFLVAGLNANAANTPVFLQRGTYSTGGEIGGFINNSNPPWMTTADVNGDGKADILVANWCMSSKQCASSTVGVLLNKGDGSFSAGGWWSSMMRAVCTPSRSPLLMLTTMESLTCSLATRNPAPTSLRATAASAFCSGMAMAPFNPQSLSIQGVLAQGRLAPRTSTATANSTLLWRTGVTI